jgi:hypothetical protein
MIVRANRFFISSVFGNVDAGRVIEMSDGKAKQLIGAGLVTAVAVREIPKVEASNFHSPVEAGRVGSLSPAGQVSQKQIVSASEFGEKKVLYRKKGKLPS